MVRANRIGPGEGLSDERSGQTCAVGVQFPVRQIPRSVRPESSPRRENGRPGTTGGEPSEIKGVVALQFGIVHRKDLGLAR